MTTPQLVDALIPLKHLPSEAVVSLHAIVVTVPDAIETTMGKSFDLDVAALTTAYQARGYELDGFAFSWTPNDVAGDEDESDDSGLARTTAGYREKHRALPSLLVFRKDDWRKPDEEKQDVPAGHAVTGGGSDVTYELVYLVGESPSYGIQPRAFEAAARCAMRYDGQTAKIGDLSPEQRCDRAPIKGRLQMIAPTYSGSMQSLAVAFKNLDHPRQCSKEDRPGGIQVHMISPTASVKSNEQISTHSFVNGLRVEYSPLSWTLREQMGALVKHLCENDLLPKKKIVFLTEESTFGQSARQLAPVLIDDLRDAASRKTDPAAVAAAKNCLDDDQRPFSITPYSFSPNISSIRAEHFRLRKAEQIARQRGNVTRGRLLELDMTSVELGSSYPPAYQPRLTSRADELMLHRRFDTLRGWGTPDVVVIVATDVRDRLFLLSEVRKALPSALPVMLVMDYLVVHPDYRQVSRGAVVVPSRDATVCAKDGWLVPCVGSSTSSGPTADCEGVYGEATGQVEPATAQTGLSAWRDKGCAHLDRQPDPCRTATQIERYPFSTDLTANVFRAVYLLDGYRDALRSRPDTEISQFVKCGKNSEQLAAPGLYVATLAGFQRLGDGRSMMVAADSRIGFARFFYIAIIVVAVFFFLIGAWLYSGAKGGSAMSNFVGIAILDARWLTRRWRQWITLRRRRASRGSVPVAGPAPELRPRFGAWLYGGAKGGSTMSNFAGIANLDARSLTRRWRQWITFMRRRASREGVPVAGPAPPLRPRWPGLPLAMAVVALMIVVVATVRLWQLNQLPPDEPPLCTFDAMCRFGLTHGRDIVAVYCVWGLYACLAFVGVIRLCISGRRYAVYRTELDWPAAGGGPRPWLIPALMAIAVALMFYFVSDVPVSVDERHPWLFALLALACSIGFLFAMGWQMRQLSRLTLWLSLAIKPVRKVSHVGDWPTPKGLQQPAQTPFNLALDEKDLASLRAASLSDWIQATEFAIKGNGFSVPGGLSFDTWQRQLVSELKLLVVAVRFAAWAAMGAPLAVLLAMSVYPPVYERWLKTTSVSLVLIGFACTIIVVLRLEKDPMLGPMFTRDGDALTFGGGLRALWPKFLAMGAVLIPLVLPEAWTAINALIRSINSLG